MARVRRAAGSVFAAVFAAAALVACGGGEDTPESPRPVLVARPGGGPASAYSAFAGEVRARQESPLAFRVAGNLVRREVDVGDRVRRGQLLAVLDPGDLRLQAQAAQAQAAAAGAELDRARADQARFAALAQDQLVSRSALDAQTTALRAAEGQARAARAQLDVARNQAGYTELRAPREGVIAAREAEAGQVVAAGQTVFLFAAEGTREVAIALPESRIRDFTVGQPVLVEPWSAPGTRLPGRIREIAPAADAQARTYAARITLIGAAADAVELGQSVRAYVAENGDRGALSLPLSAVQRGANGATTVWVVDPKSRAVRSRVVRLGPLAEDRVPVRAGVSANDWVVVAGGHLLREGQVVEPVDRQNRPVLPPAPRIAAKD